VLGIPLRQIIISLMWASFISAGITCGLVFAWIDPTFLLDQLGLEQQNRLHGYSLAFFFFWLVGIGNALLTLFFLKPVPRIKNKTL
jgi:hypothetical protein